MYSLQPAIFCRGMISNEIHYGDTLTLQFVRSVMQSILTL